MNSKAPYHLHCCKVYLPGKTLVNKNNFNPARAVNTDQTLKKCTLKKKIDIEQIHPKNFEQVFLLKKVQKIKHLVFLPFIKIIIEIIKLHHKHLTCY